MLTTCPIGVKATGNTVLCRLYGQAVADRVHGDPGVCRAFLAGASGSRSGKDRPRGRSGHPARSPEGPRATTDPAPGQGAGPAGRAADPPATQDERPGLPG